MDLFFTGDEPKIDSTDFIEKYFEFFNCKVHYYDALFLVDPLINNISESIKVFNAQVYHDVPEEFTESVKRHQFYKSAEQNKFEYILIKNIKAFDHQTARTRAEINIDNLSDLFSLFYHKSQISWKREAIILRKCCDKSSSLEHPHKGAMEKGFDYKPNKAAKKLNKLIFSLKLDTHSGSFQKFNRVADLHGICISNNIIENQLVNLWTAIETLVPSHVGTSKISAIINFILPFIVVNYIRRIIERFVTDLFLWDKEITKKIINKVSDSHGLKIYERALNLLAIDKNTDLRKEMYADLKDFHLLRFRAFSLSEILTNPESIKYMIETHKKKVSWQLRRIYRTRNIIVHSGRTPSYTETLIENGHDYLDQIMEGIMNYSCGNYEIKTLEQVFELAKIKQIKFEKTLSSLKTITRENITFLCHDEYQ